MGDMGDYWREHRQHQREQKERRRASVTKVIACAEAAGLILKRFSDEHIRVNGAFDWWPSTGLWKEINGKRRGYGVKKLISVAKERAAC